ncbi:MAG: hypothetical protein KKD31_16720 [Bacteroidetes bacterium]|nr:hypothetical protein [Bacteroidota bacterium]
MIRKIISSLMLLGMVINAGAQTYLMDNTPVSTCAGIFYDAGGSAGNYSSSQSFTKTFTSDNGQRISFNFQDFVLYADGYDYLEVFDGPTSSYQSLGKYYGTNSPGIVTSTGTSLTFYFYSNSSYASTGWSANISCSGTPLTEYNMATGTVNGCDGVFYDNAGGGASYSNSQDLTMTFCSGTTDHIIFDFVNFSLSTDDTLYAYDGSTTADPMIGAYTGASLPEKIYSRDGPCITFRFVSNATTVSTGWKAYISCSATAPTPAFNLQDGIRYTCEGTFYDNGGSSGNYSSSFMKTMTFHSFNGEQISFNFQSFALYADGYDYLEIFDGPTSSYPSLGTYYGTSSPGIVTSTGTSLTFFFYSNSSYAGAGWSANISCSGTPLTEYNMTSGTVATCEGLFFDNAGPAANYPHNENRTMTFSSGSTDKITFDFTHFSMSTEDTLYAFDGTTTSAQMIGAYTGTRLPETIYSKTGNSVTFKFVSNSTTNSNGWRALIGCSATVPAQDFLFQDGIRYTCGGTFYDNGGSTGNYTSSQNKYMVFYSDNGNRIQADFTSFALYNDGYDFMEIFDGPSTANPSLGKYYSTNSPGVVTSTGTSLTFYLYSNSSYASTGWEADLSCTTAPLTDYTMTSGTVSTCEGLFFDNGGAAGNYPNNENRVMTFTSGTTDNIVFEFTHFSVSTEDTLYAYDGATTSDPLIGIYTGTGLPEKIYSKTGNSVTFKFKSGTSTNSTGWRALISCSALDPGQVFNMQTGIRYTCGGTFNDNGGSTGNYSSSFSQAMTFKSDNGNRLTVDFSTFNLYGDGYDYLEIFDGPSNLYPSLGKYYGSNSPGIVTSANDALTFQFYSNSSYASSGWTADISCGTASLPVYPMTTGSVVACEGIFTDSGGQGAAYLQNEDNTMTFCSGTTDRIVFEFTHFYVNTDDTLFAYDGSSTSDPLI